MFAVGLVLFVIAWFLDLGHDPRDDVRWLAVIPGLIGAVLMFMSVVDLAWRWLP